MITKRELFNIVVVHTARTWERIRTEQPYEEMSCDNIESVDEILQIADEIMEDKVLKKFLRCKDKFNWDWEKESGEDFSDTYIESLAAALITNEYL